MATSKKRRFFPSQGSRPIPSPVRPASSRRKAAGEAGSPRQRAASRCSYRGDIGGILWLYWDNGKENENGNCRGYIGII